MEGRRGEGGREEGERWKGGGGKVEGRRGKGGREGMRLRRSLTLHVVESLLCYST